MLRAVLLLALTRAEKSRYSFNNLYGSGDGSYAPKSISYNWVGDDVRSGTFVEGTNPRNTYLGFLNQSEDGIIWVDSLNPCTSNDKCETENGVSLEVENQTKRPIFDPAAFPEDDFSGPYYFSPDFDLIAFRIKYEKRWRHSYKASYQIYTTKYYSEGFEGTVTERKLETIEDVWNFGFEPSTSPANVVWHAPRHLKYFFVHVSNNIHVHHVHPTDFTVKKQQLTEDGGEDILNGVPDWVYEEEMLGSKSASWFAPNGMYFIYLKSYTEGVERVRFNYYGKSDDYRARADDVLIKSVDDRYPRVETIPYSKPGGKITRIELYSCYIGDLEEFETGTNCGKLNIPEEIQKNYGPDLIFAKLQFNEFYDPRKNLPDAENVGYEAHATFMNRAQTKSTVMEVQFSGGLLSIIGSSMNTNVDTEGAGWVDPVTFIFNPESGSYFYLRYFHNDDDDCNQIEHKGNRLITSGPVCVQSIAFVSDPFLYFYASAPKKSYERHLYRLNYVESTGPLGHSEWDCVSCVSHEGRACGYASLSTPKTRDYAILSCSGPDVPYSLPMKWNSNINEWNVDELEPSRVESNQDLIDKIKKKKWPMRSFGQFDSPKFQIDDGFNYELWTPEGVDLNSGKHPLLIEIYGGPGSIKVTAAWQYRRWTQNYMTSQHDVIVASLDGRGTARRGNRMMFATYKKIGQFEKEDVSDFAQFLLNKHPGIDKSRVGIWGWSFGGYATTLSLLHNDTVFTTGVAVAPLVSRYNYDSMHTERFMALPDENKNGYHQCSILNQNLDNMNNKQYTIIAGTMDDNVHFQNAAQISKAFIRRGVEIGAMFYADEGHSINYSGMNNRHIYRTITRRFVEYFNLNDSEKKSWSNKTLDAIP